MRFSIDKELDEITLDDLENLVKSKKQEDKFLDFKRDNYSKTDTDKKELLKDISAFANSGGGELIIGIEDDKFNQAKSLTGFETNNIAMEKTRLEQIIHGGLEPILNSFRIRYVHIRDNRYVLIIRIEHSPLFPHMVSYQKFNKFYVRKSDQNLLLDIYELRNLFLKSENFMQEIRKYKQDIIEKIINNQTIVPVINDRPKVVLNFIPFDALTGNTIINLSKYDADLNFPIQRINFDGILGYKTNDKGIYSYAQLYRNGIIEYVSASNKIFDEALNPFSRLKNSEKIKVMFGDKSGFEFYLMRKIYHFLKIQKSMGIQTPVYIFLTIIGAKGYRILYTNAEHIKITEPIDRNTLSLPDVEIKKYDRDARHQIRDIFNMVWNSCGEKSSINFDRKGNWTGEKVII